MKNIVPFLKKLAKNNSREWFHANRESYECARNEFINFVSELLRQLSKSEPALRELEPSSCIFRINRDVRFSKDKSPYKKNFSAIIRQGGKKSNASGFYVHLEPGDSFLACGVYQPQPEELARIRQEIDYNLEEFTKILHSKKIAQVYGELLEEGKAKLPPRGYTKDNPALDYIKNRHFILISQLTEDEIIRKDFDQLCASRFLVARAFNDFLNRAIVME